MLTKIVKRRYTGNVNEMPAMKSIIQFTCPQCGGHQLMLVERAMHRSIVQTLETDRQGELTVGHKVLVDDLCGEPLGYRCADCRHPDCHGHDSSEGFQWHSLEEVQSAGGIVWPDGMETVEHRCMVCFPDGKMTPVIVEVVHPGTLTEKERRTVLKREQAVHGILISQSDSGIRTLSCRNWKRVKRHVLQSITNDM